MNVRKRLLIASYSLQNNQKRHKARLCCYLFFIVFFQPLDLLAQQKTLGSELGFRYGEAPALSYRFYFEELTGFELLFAKSEQSLLFTALYEKLQPREFAGFYTYYGFGGSMGGWNNRQRLSLDMVLGTCYFVPYVPLNIDFALRPYLVLNGLVAVNAELAVSVRWVF